MRKFRRKKRAFGWDIRARHELIGWVKLQTDPSSVPDASSVRAVQIALIPLSVFILAPEPSCATPPPRQKVTNLSMVTGSHTAPDHNGFVTTTDSKLALQNP